MPKTGNLRDFWMDELKDLYNMEGQILKVLPRLVKTAGSDDLRDALEHHRKQTEGQVERLDKIFDQLGMPARGKKCAGMEGILAEGKELLEEDFPEPVADAAMIGAAQRVEHYEIAAYGTARTHAQILGESDAAQLLEETLEEEKAADQKLTQIAEDINPEAEQETSARAGGNGEMATSHRRTSARR